MKSFFLGIFFGFLFSGLALWFVKVSPWAFLPAIRAEVFVVGGAVLGGLINLLLGNRDVSTE